MEAALRWQSEELSCVRPPPKMLDLKPDVFAPNGFPLLGINPFPAH